MHMFQSHLGSILPILTTNTTALYDKFQSHLGSILPQLGRALPAEAICFNPTLVRFCHLLVDTLGGDKARFNPTLVRFCHGNGRPRRASNGRFQSHLGSILPHLIPHRRAPQRNVSIPPWFDFAASRASSGSLHSAVSIPPWFDFALTSSLPRASTSCVSIPPWFDFACSRPRRQRLRQSVSIPPWFDFADTGAPATEGLYVRFNPTLVRFCPRRRNDLLGGQPWFQSHLGSILPRTVVSSVVPAGSFNPTLVRFCHPAHHSQVGSLRVVSIPPWFDFAHLSCAR